MELIHSQVINPSYSARHLTWYPEQCLRSFPYLTGIYMRYYITQDNIFQNFF